MKSQIISEKPKKLEIDWDKQQIVKSKNGNYYFTTGNHSSSLFTGTRIHSDLDINLEHGDFAKSDMQPVESPITIKFEF